MVPLPRQGRGRITRPTVRDERFESIPDAIRRETSLKRRDRAWKARLIVGMNPEWRDLSEELAG